MLGRIALVHSCETQARRTQKEKAGKAKRRREGRHSQKSIEARLLLLLPCPLLSFRCTLCERCLWPLVTSCFLFLTDAAVRWKH